MAAAVTLQLGHYAGCVGAHWWGLQEAAPRQAAELRAAVLLREAAGREPPAPRLVALELKGAGTWPPTRPARSRTPGGGGETLPRRARAAAALLPEVRAIPAPPFFWPVLDAPPPLSRLTAYQDVYSGGSVQVWSDYLKVHLHPKSVFVIHQYNHDGDSGRLEAFGQGESLVQDPVCLEELEDRLHFFVEECDYLQGFQVLCDLHNGFSGVGAKVTELLHDEYCGRGILTWGLTPVMHKTGREKDFYRLMNTALGIVHLSSQSSLFCPLSLSGSLGIKSEPPITFPYINYDASLNYHSSAILAAVLDTLTVPYRLSTSQCSMMHLAEMLNFSGRKVVAALAAVPFPIVHGHSLPDTLGTHQQNVPWKLLSSYGEQKVSRCFAQSVVLRGICKENCNSNCPGKQPASALHACETAEQILQHYLHTLSPGAFSTSHVLKQPCHTLPPYPQFFSSLLTREGFLLDRPLSYSSTAVESIPVLTALQSSPVLHTVLYSLYRDLQKLDTRRWASFFSTGVEQDDFKEALHELRTLAQCYKTSFEADESEDETDSD
ncbi:protein misato homolog 1 isoform X2 [Struthio camelus]|uniref:protein misato homolog 1 isoform X2 n=1 Tax=Struthio camelus TaxID=8801 RepID=UPI003603C3E5